MAIPEPSSEECDHDWKFVDDSFSHEFGTEQIHFKECQICGITENVSSSDYEFDDPVDEDD